MFEGPHPGRGSRAAAIAILLLFSASCGKNKEAAPGAPAATSAAVTSAPSAPANSAATGSPPPDGKYERVMVDGVTVPMINVMNAGAVVLLDTDGKKPRTWEEQYKRKRDTLSPGQFDIHKTDTNKNDSFQDEPVDKEGLWVIDSKGNITKH